MAATTVAPKPASTYVRQSPITKRDERVWEFDSAPDEMWETGKAFVDAHWPEAKHEGVGYWRLPREAHITYSIGRIGYHPMKGKPLPGRDFA